MTEARESGFRWWLIALAALGAWGAFLALFGPKGTTGDLPVPRLDPPVPPRFAEYGWPLEDLTGSRADLSAYRGRAVFLNVWATWCGPCLVELPSIINLASNPRLKDVAFVGVSTDQDAEVLRRFVKRRALKFPILRASSVPGAFESEGIPTTFLIAPDGRIAASHVGAGQWDDPSVVDFLEGLSRQPGRR